MPPMDLPPTLARPALRALERAGISDLTDLTQVTREEVAALHGMGPKALGVLTSALGRHGLSFRPPP